MCQVSAPGGGGAVWCSLPASLQAPADNVPTRQSNSSIKSAMRGETAREIK